MKHGARAVYPPLSGIAYRLTDLRISCLVWESSGRELYKFRDLYAQFLIPCMSVEGMMGGR